MTKVGRFIVGTGQEFGCREENWYQWIVTDKFGEVQGHYGDSAMAFILANALPKIDRMNIDAEVDQILRQK